MSTTIKPIWVGIILVTVVANGVLYAIYSKERHRESTAMAPPQPQPLPPPPPAAADETQVEFRSSPYGAQVFEGDTLLGQTPLMRVYARPEQPADRSYRFELDGFFPFEITRPIGGERVLVEARLIAEPAPPKAESPARQRRNRKKRAADPPPRPAPPPPPPPPIETVAVPKVKDDFVVPRVGEDEAVPKVGRDETVPRVGKDDDEVPRL